MSQFPHKTNKKDNAQVPVDDTQEPPLTSGVYLIKEQTGIDRENDTGEFLTFKSKAQKKKKKR